jgi:hypothetical protein
VADWPEFELTDERGGVTTWTREGDSRRYAPGVGIRLTYVEHPWKPVLGRDEPCQVVLGVWLEETAHRVSGFAPGPGGHGYRLARMNGAGAHYIYMPDRGAAERLLVRLEASGHSGRVWGGGTPCLWITQVWAPDTETVEADRARLSLIARDNGGRYDGGEIIEGAVWGPTDAG